MTIRWSNRDARPPSGTCSLRLIVCAVLGFVAGCSPSRRFFYPGPPRPAADVAVVRATGGAFVPYFFVQFVDGDEVLGIWDIAYDHFPTVELPPGQHKLSIAFKYTGFFATVRNVQNCVVALDAEAGHEYEIQGRMDHVHDTWEAWARNVRSGRDTQCLFIGSLATPPQ